MNDLTDKRMMTCNVWEGGMNGGRRDCIEGKVAWEGWRGKEKNNRMSQTSLPNVNV